MCPVIDAESFARLDAEGYNRIPVVREVLSDLDTLTANPTSRIRRRF
jgi:hypothetical protein